MYSFFDLCSSREDCKKKEAGENRGAPVEHDDVDVFRSGQIERPSGLNCA